MTRILGSLTVLDLHGFSQHFGRTFMPYPFRFVRPIPLEYDEEMDRYRSQLLERYASGEFDHLQRWLEVQLREADIRVECLYVNSKTGVSNALSATRWRDLGFVAEQDAEDVISITQVSPYELGTEVVKRTALAGKPGAHERVIIPSVGIRSRTAKPRNDSTATIFDRITTADDAVRLEPDEVIAGGEIQTAFLPAKRWGRDRTKDFIGWVRTTSGDYAVHSPYEFAVPTTRKQLVERIDRSIAADVAQIRDARRGDGLPIQPVG